MKKLKTIEEVINNIFGLSINPILRFLANKDSPIPLKFMKNMESLIRQELEELVEQIGLEKITFAQKGLDKDLVRDRSQWQEGFNFGVSIIEDQKKEIIGKAINHQSSESSG